MTTSPATLTNLLPRLASARRLVADIEAEIRALGRTVPTVPLCHPDRPVAGILVNSQPACNHCAALALGVPPRDVWYALAGEPDAGEYSDEWVRPTRGNPWGD